MTKRGSVILNILMLLLFSAALNLYAETLNFRNFTVKDGLANSTVYYIFQDSKGFIWFATETGVNRFDGQKFELFTMDNGLSDNEVLEIHEDSKGRIWFLTLNGKLSYYYNKKFYNTSNDPLLKNSICPGSFISFFEDSAHRLWFTTNQDRILRIDGHKPHWIYGRSKYSLANCSLISAGRGKVLAMGNNQILEFHEGKFIPLQNAIYPVSPRSVAPDPSSGGILFLSEKGLVKYKDGLFKVVSKRPLLPGVTTGDFMVESPSKMWIGTMGQGLLLLNSLTSPPKRYLKGQSITGIMKDRQGCIWISTIGNGVYMLPFYNAYSVHLTTEDGLSSNAVSSLVKTRDKIILGFRNGNLDILSKGTILHKTFNQPTAYDPVKRLYYDKRSGSVFYASNNSLIEIEPGPENKYILRGENKNYALKSFSINSKGDIAVALASGVYIINRDGKGNSLLKRPHFLNRAFSVFYDSSDRLWFSNIEGLQYYENGVVTPLYTSSPALRQRITDIAELPGKTLVCSTYGFGVFILKNNKLAKVITTSDGLRSNICTRVLIENKKAWIVTGKGISVIDFKNPSPAISSFGSESGLISNEVNDIFVQNDTAYIATNNGFSVFKPAAHIRQEPPPLFLKDILANKTAFDPRHEQTLSYNQNNITVNYIALDFVHPSRIMYSYRLRQDAKWIETPGNSIEFGSLEPGSYHLEIRAKSLNTAWGPPLRIPFLIVPPFWQTWWFALILTLLAGFTIFIILRWYFRTRQAEEKEKLLVKTRIISLEQQALQAMMNPHFIFNVMNSIQYFINTREHTMANQVLTGFARLIRKNLDICNKSYISIEEEVNYLSLYLSLEKMRFGDKMDYSIETDKEIDIQETYIPSMLLQPFVENAIWHGIMPKDNKGIISIQINKHNGHLEISIIDDGIGIENSLRQKKGDYISRGMKLTEQRINLLNKYRPNPITIEVTPVPTGGTRVAITIPLKPFTNWKAPLTQ